MIASMSWYGLIGIKRHIQNDIKSDLETILHITHEALYNWIDDQVDGAIFLAEDPRLRQAVDLLLQKDTDPKVLLNCEALVFIRDYFNPFLRIQGDQGFFVVDPDYINIASMRDENIGITKFTCQSW